MRALSADALSAAEFDACLPEASRRVLAEVAQGHHDHEVAKILLSVSVDG